LRGKILKYLLKNSQIAVSDLSQKLKLSIKKIYEILKQLEKEGFLTIEGENVIITQ
jgi:DNA-binding Lrp family transcriptional regulator